jgi:hypothetical protein
MIEDKLLHPTLGLSLPQEKIKEKEYHLMSRYFYDHFLRRNLLTQNDSGSLGNRIRDIKFYPGKEKDGGKLKHILSVCENVFGRILKAKKAEFHQLLSGMKAKTFSDDEEMLVYVVDEIYKFVNSNFTREELEENYKLFRKNNIPLNEIMDCNFDKKNPYELRVHLIATSDVSAQKVQEAFKILANKLQNAPENSKLKKAKVISLTSWILYEKPIVAQRMEKLGFTLIPASDYHIKIKERRMEITPEKFIELFSKK